MKRISTGIENFKELLDNNYYYVDKTRFIEDVLSDKVMLYTRARRFGKTLNLSMLYYFFSNKEKENSYLFEGLNISKDKEILKHQNQYPVIFLTLKDMNNNNFQSQIYIFTSLIANIIDIYAEIKNSDTISQRERKLLDIYQNAEADINDLKISLKILSQCLYKHYQQKVIILIDEYDVPLQSAYNNGYYDEMVDFLRSVFSSALKTNDALERGVLTGCLRIAKESIFTGLNNFTVRSITSQYACDCFGFTQEEIDDLLDYYDLINKRDEIKDWYDGYLFDKTEIYNPWSVLNYIKELLGDKDFHAISFWANTSSNDLVRQYIENATMKMKEEFEELINGKSIIKKITPELTYREMNFKSSKDMNDNVYSFLLFTGYLKIKEKVYENNELVEDTYKLVIPNKEVKKIYENIFIKWFREYQNERDSNFIDALIQEDVIKANSILQDVLLQSISYYDNYESFYHGFMVGFLNADGYEVQSNRESGEGRFDLAVLPYSILNTAIIIECKHSNSIKELRKDSKEASDQIIEKRYIEGLRDEGYENVIGYGISFYKKQCIITKA
ncbi:MAG TPA: ATP-binding protein [Candidatus Erysipelatoclostridium merdavium]|uniref:ATP-binding protein n=1 Tax=Candidatus Erysipelatoclostridium merdavium TaxID=2838566 RepID=A0A9D1XME8_9FIRM|nr:ATP-binding protein [Candidatus Erysipelatoclostridium merdavium]